MRTAEVMKVLLVAGVLLCLPMSVAFAHDPNKGIEFERYSLEVSDLDRALEFYDSVLRLEVVGTLNHPAKDTDATQNANELRVDEVLLLSTGSFALGLMEFQGDVGPVRTGSIRLITTQLDRIVPAARDLGLAVSDEVRGSDPNGFPIRRRLIEDWDGNQITLEQHIHKKVLDGRCVEVGAVQSWELIDDHHLFIRGNVPESTLLLTTSRCRGARYARRVVIPNSEGILCGEDSRIAYVDASLRRTCRVNHLQKVADVEEAIQAVEEKSNNKNPDRD